MFEVHEDSKNGPDGANPVQCATRAEAERVMWNSVGALAEEADEETGGHTLALTPQPDTMVVKDGNGDTHGMVWIERV